MDKPRKSRLSRKKWTVKEIEDIEQRLMRYPVNMNRELDKQAMLSRSSFSEIVLDLYENRHYDVTEIIRILEEETGSKYSKKDVLSILDAATAPANNPHDENALSENNRTGPEADNAA